MKMKQRNTLRMLPLVALLTLGLALPAASMADDDRGRGKDRVYQKHDGGKGYRDHGKSHGRDKGRYERGHGHKGYAKSHDRGHKRVYNYSKGHHHGYSHHGHKHRVYRPHNHVQHVIVHDYHDEYDPFRLLLGLHFDNIDIIYRDY
jgi:hypothetical protein